MTDTPQPGAVTSVSAVIPVYNEQDNVGPLLDELAERLEALALDHEIVIVDDGSTDETWRRLQRYAEEHASVLLRSVKLRRNFGQTAALATGFKLAGGEVIVTLDGDLQNDPTDIGALLECLRDGADVACGWRRERKEGWIRAVPSKAAAWVISRLAGLRLHDFGCTLRAYRREIVGDLDLLGDMHRFIPALCHAVGAKVVEIPVRHRPRLKGEAKYGRTGLQRLFRVGLDLLSLSLTTRYLTRPVRVYGWWAVGGVLAAGATALAAAVWGAAPAAVLGLVLLLLGLSVTLVGLGGAAELAARAYLRAAGRPAAYVRCEARSPAWEQRWGAADEIPSIARAQT